MSTPESRPGAGANLQGFLEAAGRSLADAQGALVGGVSDAPTTLAISTAELEIKAGLTRGADGALVLETVSVQDAMRTGFDAAALSTVRVQFVALTDEAGPARSLPTRTPAEIIERVRAREDVGTLERVVTDLHFDAVFVPATRRWVVRATDAEDRVVRELLVPDEP